MYVQSSGRDFGHVTGLCSKEDGINISRNAEKGLPHEMTGVQQWR